MKNWKWIFLSAIAATSLMAGSADAGRNDLDQIRARLMRVQIRLQHEAERAPAVIEAHKVAGGAYSEMYQRRAEVLTRLYQTDEYKDLRLALYHTQRRLSGAREEIPLRIQRIMDSATDALAVRVQITRLEANALEADPDFVQVRDAANAMNAAYRQALRDSLESVRNNPEFMGLVDQLWNAQSSVTGMRSTARLNRGG
jgi:hypothetical protein